MGDRGQEAIHAAGRVIEPECRTSISQLFVSSCSTVPTRRVLSVAAVMDVAWTILQPASLRRAARRDRRCRCGSRAGILAARHAAGASAGCSHAQPHRQAPRRCDAAWPRASWLLRKPPDNASAEKIEREFFNLFIGIGRGELLPYGSYYLTGFLNERPLARLREDLRALGIERAEGQVEAGGSRRHPLRDHGRAGQRPVRDNRSSCSSSFSRNISPPGSGASSPIWSEPRRPISIAMWERSAGFSWRSRQKHSRCRRERQREHRRTRR